MIRIGESGPEIYPTIPWQAMNSRRLFLNIGFWIIFSAVFDPASSFFFPDLPMDAALMLWFSGLCIGTFLFNLCWYFLAIRRR